MHERIVLPETDMTKPAKLRSQARLPDRPACGCTGDLTIAPKFESTRNKSGILRLCQFN